VIENGRYVHTNLSARDRQALAPTVNRSRLGHIAFDVAAVVERVDARNNDQDEQRQDRSRINVTTTASARTQHREHGWQC